MYFFAILRVKSGTPICLEFGVKISSQVEPVDADADSMTPRLHLKACTPRGKPEVCEAEDDLIEFYFIGDAFASTDPSNNMTVSLGPVLKDFQRCAESTITLKFAPQISRA